MPGAVPSAGRLRWLLLATHVPPGGADGGMVRYTVEMARALARDPRIELTVLARQASGDWFSRLVQGRAQVQRLPDLPTAARSVLEREAVGVPALRAEYDVVHGTKHLLPRRRDGVRGRRLLTVHDMLPLDRPGDFGFTKRHLIRGPYLGSLRSADVLACVSAATRDRLCAYLPEVRGRARVVHLATSEDLRTGPSVVVPRLSGRVFALVVGDPSRRKNLPFLMEVWEAVVRTRPDAVLALVGPPGWGPARRGDTFTRLERAGFVTHLGRLPDAQLRWCYEQAAVVLCPSLLEGFGLPAAEALSFGAPLLTSDDPALCEVSGPRARHLSTLDAAGWVSAVGEALARPRGTSAGAGRERQERTWEDVAGETVQAVADAS